MALGLQGPTSGRTLQIRLAEAVGAGGLGAPTLPSEGYNLLGGTVDLKAFRFEDRGTIMIHKTAGTAVSIASARLYGYYAGHAEGVGPDGWGPMGSGASTDRGKLNLAGIIAQVGDCNILLLEDIDGLLAVDRIFVALGAITGVGAAVCVDLILKRRVR